MTNEQIVKPDADGCYRIKGDRPAQLLSTACLINELLLHLDKETGNEALVDCISSLRGRDEQLRIIAGEIERRPEANIFAQRIYSLLPTQTKPGMYEEILAILEDKYAHLNDEQREKIRYEAANIMAAGNGSEDTEQGCMSYDQARAEIDKETIEMCIEISGECDWEDRIDFDPRTGKPWYTDESGTES